MFVLFQIETIALQAQTKYGTSMTSSEVTFALSNAALRNWAIEDVDYSADRQALNSYLPLMLKKWHDELKKDPTQTTQEILKKVDQSDAFMIRHAPLRKKIFTDPTGLPGTLRAGPFLAALSNVDRVQTEGDKARWQLRAALQNLAASSAPSEKILALQLANHYAGDPELQDLVGAIRQSVPLQNWSDRGATLRNYLVVFPSTPMIATKITLGVGAKALETTWKVASSTYRFARSRSLQTKSVAASVAGHAAVAHTLLSPAKVKAVEKKEVKDPDWLYVGGLENRAPPSEDEIVPSNQGMTRHELVENLRRAALGKNWDGALSTYLEMENHQGLGAQKFSALGRDISFSRLGDFEKNAQAYFEKEKNNPNLAEVLSKFLGVTFETILLDYSRDRASLSDVLLGGGGNCMAQALVITSTLMKNKDKLPPGIEIGIRLEPQHTEPVLIFEGRVYALTKGEITIDDGQDTIIKPEGFYKNQLKELTGENLVEPSDYIRGGPNSPLAQKLKDDGLSPKKIDGFGFLSHLSQLIHRRGPLNLSSYSTFQLKRGSDGEVPEFAKMSFSGFSGLIGRRSSRSSSSSFGEIKQESTQGQLDDFEKGKRDSLTLRVEKQKRGWKRLLGKTDDSPSFSIDCFANGPDFPNATMQYLNKKICLELVQKAAESPDTKKVAPLVYSEEMTKFLLDLSERQRNHFLNSDQAKSCQRQFASENFVSTEDLNFCIQTIQSSISNPETHLAAWLQRFSSTTPYSGTSAEIRTAIDRINKKKSAARAEKAEIAKSKPDQTPEPKYADPIVDFEQLGADYLGLSPVEQAQMLRANPTFENYFVSGWHSHSHAAWSAYLDKFLALRVVPILAARTGVQVPKTEKSLGWRDEVYDPSLPVEHLEEKTVETEKLKSQPRTLDMSLRNFVLVSAATRGAGMHLWTQAVVNEVRKMSRENSSVGRYIKAMESEMLGRYRQYLAEKNLPAAAARNSDLDFRHF